MTRVSGVITPQVQPVQVNESTSGENKNQPHIRWMILHDRSDVLNIESSTRNPWSAEALQHCMNRQNCIGMVATKKVEEDEKIVGFMVYEIGKTYINILKFVVHPDHLNQGIDTGMVNKLVSKLSSDKRTKLLVIVPDEKYSAFKNSAKEFFESVGFHALGQSHDSTAIMEYALPGYQTTDETTLLKELVVSNLTYPTFKIPLAIRLFLTGEPTTGMDALEKLARYSEPHINAPARAATDKLKLLLTGMAQSPTEPLTRVQAATLLCIAGNSQTGIPILHELLKDTSPTISTAAESALDNLAKLDSKQGISTLKELVRDPSVNPITRTGVALAMYSLRSPEKTNSILNELADDENPLVRDSAKQALNELAQSGKKEGVAFLETFARDQETELKVKISLATALSLLGEVETGITILQELVNKPELEASKPAIFKALDLVKDKVV